MLRKRVLYWGTSLVVQWLRTLLAVQRTLVQSLVRELRAYMLCRAAKKIKIKGTRKSLHLGQTEVGVDCWLSRAGEVLGVRKLA